MSDFVTPWAPQSSYIKLYLNENNFIFEPYFKFVFILENLQKNRKVAKIRYREFLYTLHGIFQSVNVFPGLRYQSCYIIFLFFFLDGLKNKLWTCATLFLKVPQCIARQVPLSMRFLSQEYWSGLPFSPPGYLPNPGIKAASFLSPAAAGRFFTNCTIWEAPFIYISWLIDFYVTLGL